MCADKTNDDEMGETTKKLETSSGASKKSFCGHDSIEEFTKAGMRLIMDATKAVNGLPSGSSRDLYTAYSAFIKAINVESEKALHVVSNVIKMQGIKGNIVNRDKEEKFELLQECNDAMLERINLNLDEMSGLKKSSESLMVTEVKSVPLPRKYILASSSDRLDPSMQTAKLIIAKNILRPQVNFKTPVDNSNNPFVPRIKEKPWSLKPLAILPEYDDDGNILSYLHPYEFEIEKFEPPPNQLCELMPQKPLKIEETPLAYVDSEEKLKEMIQELGKESQIAVDLEHHSFRTFQGITCLMQISSRAKDYIVDTILLRDELYALNEIFANSNIVKVFHGADCDIEWLQKDLSLYIVNMFDTHQAAKRLSFPRLSLAFLLKHYCNIDADKTFQLADWRMRPLPQELIKYAQQDTHNLLYIFDMLTNELLKLGNDQPNILKSVYQSSKELCLKKYIKPMFTDDCYMDLYRKSKRFFDNRQLFAMKEIYAWRDKISRLEDESYAYVLPNHMLLQISESLPREMQGILACCNPIPPLVRQHLHALHQIILKARDQPLIKPMLPDQDRPRPSVNARDKKDLVNNPLYCPHDLSQFKEIRDDLPTILGEKKIVEKYENLQLKHLILNAFEKNGKTSHVIVQDLKFVAPYQRYKLMIPYLEELKKKEELLEEERKKNLALAKVVPLKQEEPAKVSDPYEDLYKMPLKELKKRKFDANETKEVETPQKPISKKRKIQEVKESTPAKTEVPEIKEEPHSNSQASNNSVPSPQNNKRWKKKKNKAQKAADFRQNSNKPLAFDYSKVDYRKFQGGTTSQQPQDPNKINLHNQKFKSGKAGKGKNKKMDNMFSFANVKISKHQKK